MNALAETEHPHVKRDEAGYPVVGKHATSLHVLAEYWRLGWTLDELAAGYPHLAMAEILDALSFYLDHRAEVDALIRANRAPNGTAA